MKEFRFEKIRYEVENMCDTTFPVQISEKQFMRQYEIAKHYVDMGIQDYFILFDNDAFANVSEIGNTTLEDISSVFGKDFQKPRKRR